MQSKNKTYTMERQKNGGGGKTLRSWIILLVIIVALAGLLTLLGNVGKTTEISANRLTCFANQDVTPFGDSVLYYDGASIHCLSGVGAIKWSFPVGAGASFSCSDTHLVIWQGSQLYIVDKDGHPTYNEAQDEPIQFARIGNQYAAAVIGEEDTKATLVIKDMEGSPVDEETDQLTDLLVLDVGFYGEQDQYIWTLSMDVYGTAINSLLHTYQVGKLNTGTASLGEKLAYSVVYENNKLRVFTTQQLYSYNYKAVQDTNDTKLVYGWKLMDTYIPERGNGNLLLAPISQNSNTQSISELRLISGETDRRYTLPSSCVGAMTESNSVYAFSSQYIYRTNVNEQRFYAYNVPLQDGDKVTGYIGKLDGGRVLLTSGEMVYSVQLPQ